MSAITRWKLIAVPVIASWLALAACAAMAGKAIPPPPPARGAVASPMEHEAFDAINDVRARAGLPKLELSAQLTRTARAHSEYQARVGKSGHEGEGGTSPADRARADAIACASLAENVAMNYGYHDAVATAVSSWMNSAPHRRNILSEEFSQTGVGVATAVDGRTYFTQMFLAPTSPR